MGTPELGGGLILAAAAGLWLVYLLPTWFRRREYLATERNAVRLQQTLRVMAATAELPREVLAENSARGVAAQERALRAQQKLNDAASRSRGAQVARAERLAQYDSQPPVVARRPIDSARTLSARRLRRTRAVVALVLLGSLITFVAQLGVLLVTGPAAGTSAVLGFSAIAFLTSFASLGRLARVARSRRAVPAAEERRVAMSAPVVQDAVETGWTPVPLPRPLYLSRPSAQPWPMTVEPGEELRVAALEADRALRAAQADPAVASIAQASSRFAAMGIVNTADAAGPDLDAVLRRRRAAG